ncbi:MAG TPA: phosphodiester glycosidase family protein [Candidatus Limiplasma sp.]|nr:phosphodiester glycosidase family protein [Candidatus Limiplasma sp.]
MRIFQKPFRWAILYAAVLTVFSAYVLLDAFVIPRAYATVTDSQTTQAQADTAVEDVSQTTAESADTQAVAAQAEATVETIITDTSYSDANLQISIETLYVDDTAVYIADIQVSDAACLQTALAKSTYGRNVTQTTSAIAQENGAIFAVNGDYYGFRNDGYVIRNGVLYRSVSGGGEDLVIDSDGNFSIIEEDEVSAQSLLNAGAWQVLSFGPALVNDGEIVVSSDSEVSQSKSSNPRTAIGQISALHYLVIVSDGRTGESAGLSLMELAELFAQRGCTVAYNLDGGGSTTMWFNGTVINNPTDGRNYGERKVSDIVYFE